MVGFDTGKWSDSSPADRGRSRKSCSTRRRVGSASALNTLFTDLYLANYLNIVKRQRRAEPEVGSGGDEARGTETPRAHIIAFGADESERRCSLFRQDKAFETVAAGSRGWRSACYT